jgi:hypothetical protein
MAEPTENNVLFFADGPLCPKLQGFLDGVLNEVEAASFRDHLCGCAACADALEDALQLELLMELSLNEKGPADRFAGAPGLIAVRPPLRVQR